MIKTLLLAAGAGRRFVGAKLLTLLPDRTPLILAAVRPLRQAGLSPLAVVRPEHTALQELLTHEGVDWIINTHPERGMGSSIACGVSAARDANGWLIALADMPYIRAETIEAVHAALASGSPLVAPFHDGRRGHPVAFSAVFRDELLALDGDTGARAILERHGDRLTALQVDDPGILRDIDTPADL